MPARSRLFATLASLIFAAFSLATTRARAADPAIPITDAPVAPAPGITRGIARREASETLRSIVASRPLAERRAVTGVYVAFDGDAITPYALAACDDDGDYVVVVSDAMLLLVDFVAHAASTDETFGTSHLTSYAAFLAADQRATARLLAPPAGAFNEEQENDDTRAALEVTRRDELLAWLLADELSHATHDLVCASPTATREAGDDVWTVHERARALEAARARATPHVTFDADLRADAWIGDTKRGFGGRDAWLGFVATVGARPPLAVYIAMHPRTP